MFRLSNEEELDIQTLSSFISDHRKWVDKRYKPLMDAYMTRYPIFDLPAKPDWKPDKRIAVNFAKYITDTMNGFFIGIPIKIDCDEESIAEYVEYLDQYNDQDDNNAELSKLCSIYGKGYEMYYVDDLGNIGITYLSPEDAFMIYDDSILERPRYFCRIYKDADDTQYVSVSDSHTVRYASMEGGLHWLPDEEKIHGFKDVPAAEFRENEEEIGIFEPVLTMINEYNEAISEKANDVAYFADAYLKILGALVDEESLEQIRQNRIINFPGNLEGCLLYTSRTMTTEQKIQYIANHYGYESQSRQLVEELSELIQAICKHNRTFAGKRLSKLSNCPEKDAITEELADVIIMMHQLDYLIGINANSVYEVIKRKLDRQIERINHGR